MNMEYAKRQDGDRNGIPARSRYRLTEGDHDHEDTGPLPRRGEGHLDEALRLLCLNKAPGPAWAEPS